MYTVLVICIIAVMLCLLVVRGEQSTRGAKP